MVQKEINKKTKNYGLVALLSATILVSMIYVFGTVPGLFPPSDLPPVLAMDSFSSYDELKNFLATNTQENYINYFGGGPLDARVFDFAQEAAPPPAPTPAPNTIGDGTYSNDDSYSTTNIQVAGVDESDIVKTDGKYIYVATNNFYSTNKNSIYIVKADQADPRVIAEIPLDNTTYVAGLFLSQDGNKLVVLGSQYLLYSYVEPRFDATIYPYYNDVTTMINVYDITEKTQPVIARNLTLTGSYFNSRMIGNYLYLVVSQPSYDVYEEKVLLPQVNQDAQISEIMPERIFYSNKTIDTYFTFTTFISLNIIDDLEPISDMTILMGGTSTMYVSLDNLYVTYSTWNNGQYTSIYRVSINENNLSFEAKGSVPGYVLNQYSMDEYNGYFRIATTWQNITRVNNIYVLNMNMSMVGKVENLAENERIYSVRFMGDKGYMVTFRQIDPFFVLDLSNPTEPKVAGELKIPGYSSYLHPYNENRIIGLGKEDNNVKLSLFDVSDVNSPKEIAKYIVEGEYTDSQALNDPKAFLFDREKQLLVIPISIMNYGVIDPVENETITKQGGFWQGAYVFSSTANDFIFRDRITHNENPNPDYYWLDSNDQVNRAIYIRNYLYTISNSKIKINTLDTLDFVNEVELS